MTTPGSCIDCGLVISDIWYAYQMNQMVDNDTKILNKHLDINQCCYKHSTSIINTYAHMGLKVYPRQIIDKDTIVKTWESFKR